MSSRLIYPECCRKNISLLSIKVLDSGCSFPPRNSQRLSCYIITTHHIAALILLGTFSKHHVLDLYSDDALAPTVPFHPYHPYK